MRLLGNRQLIGKTTHRNYYEAYNNEILYLLTINVLTDTENTFVVATGERVGGVLEWEVEVSRCKLL